MFIIVYATPGGGNLSPRYRMIVATLIEPSVTNTQSWSDIKLLAEGVTLLSK